MLPESPGCLRRPREGPGRLREAPRRLLESVPESPGRSREGLARVSGGAGRVPGGPGEATGEPVEASRGPRLSESCDKQKPLKTHGKHVFLRPRGGARGAPEGALAASKALERPRRSRRELPVLPKWLRRSSERRRVASGALEEAPGLSGNRGP